MLVLAVALPVASAVPSSNIEPPGNVVLRNWNPVTYQNGYGVPNVGTTGWLNYTRSPSDPGTWTYDICQQLIQADGTPVTGYENGICSFGTSPTPIPNRPGWLSTGIGFSQDLSGFELPLYWRVNVSTNDTAGFSSYASPTLNLSSIETGQVQTGNYDLRQPDIVNVTVAEALTVSTGRTQLIFRHSVNDSNASTTGDFRYPIVAQYIQPGEAPRPFPKTNQFTRGLFKLVTGQDAFDAGTPSTTVPVFYESPTGAGNAGLRYFNVTYSGSSPFYLSLSVVPIDNATDWMGNASCLTTVDPSKTSQVNRCGLFVGSGINAGTGAVITPSFPGLDVPAFVAATGLTTENAGYILSGILLLALYGVGFWIGGTGGGAVAGILSSLGAGLGYYLGLLGAWVIIVVFILAAIVVVMGMMSGRGGRR